MLNYIWSGMLIIGIVTAMFTGSIHEVTLAIIESSKEAVKVCLAMLGITAFWTGIMKMGEEAGLIDALSKRMSPIMTFLFPKVPRGHVALKHISTNMIANLFGLGWAATPAGLKAMDELDKLNNHSKKASDDMCMFMIVNMSSLQIVTLNIIVYRAEYGSENPSEIIAAGFMATVVSTVVAVIFAKLMYGRNSERENY